MKTRKYIPIISLLFMSPMISAFNAAPSKEYEPHYETNYKDYAITVLEECPKDETNDRNRTTSYICSIENRGDCYIVIKNISYTKHYAFVREYNDSSYYLDKYPQDKMICNYDKVCGPYESATFCIDMYDKDKTIPTSNNFTVGAYKVIDEEVTANITKPISFVRYEDLNKIYICSFNSDFISQTQGFFHVIITINYDGVISHYFDYLYYHEHELWFKNQNFDISKVEVTGLKLISYSPEDEPMDCNPTGVYLRIGVLIVLPTILFAGVVITVIVIRKKLTK